MPPISSHHHPLRHHNKLIWTKQVRYWRLTFLPTCLIHSLAEQTMPKKHMAEFLSLPSTIEHADDGRKKRKPRASSTSTRAKRRPSLLSYYTRGISDSPAPEDRPLKRPGENWPRELERRHPELKARKDRPQEWNRFHIYDKVVKWFEVMGKELQNPSLLPENVYNMDETGVMLNMPSSVKVLVGKDDIRSHRASRVKRTMVTAIECVSGDGRCLNPMIVWPAKTQRANWTTHPTPGWFYAHSETGFSDSYISLQWLKLVFDPQTKERAGKRPRMLIWEGFGTHETLEILEFCFSNNIILCRMPSHSSHKLQPCDVAVFGPLKAAYREQVERMERGGVNTINKQHFTYLYSPARERSMTKKNILGGWRGSGLFPFDPDRVFAETPKPPPEITIPNIDEVRSCAQDEVPPTPATPVAVEGLTTLHKLIKQDTAGLDEANQRRLQRHVQKLTNAAHTSFSTAALQQERIQFLLTINDEAKVRRSTKAIIIGDARVMSWEDLEKARTERAAKDAAKANGKGKRGRKLKNAVPDADASEADEQVADMARPSTSGAEPGKGGRGRKHKSAAEPDAPGPKAKVARMSDTQADAPEPKAPVAFMSKTQLAAEDGLEDATA